VTSSSRFYGFSISPEHGVTGAITAELVPEALGASGHSTTVTADLRAYLPGLDAHHVLAMRAGGGVSSGDAEMRRTFVLGGAGPNGAALNFADDAFSLLRGFETDTFAGARVAVLNVDYRWPIARPERGIRTWPVFLHTLHAAVFADAGHAWTRRFRTSDVKTSAGAELSANLVLGYSLPLTLTAGGGWGRDGARRVNDGATFYVRVGRAF
jgi:outer membrane protein assembly factor BamA